MHFLIVNDSQLGKLFHIFKANYVHYLAVNYVFYVALGCYYCQLHTVN